MASPRAHRGPTVRADHDDRRLRGPDRDSSQIAQWVAQRYRPTKIGGTTAFWLL